MNKIKKYILLVTIMVITIISLYGNFAYADSTVKIKMDSVRYDADGNQIEAYVMYNGADQKLFQLLSVNDENQITGTNYYCLNAVVGASWITGSVGATVEYNKQYDFENISLDANDSSITAYKKVEDNEYLSQLLWVIDNMYVKDGTKTINDLLTEAGILYDNTYDIYYYDETINPSSVFSDTSSPLYLNAYGNGSTAGYFYFDENNNKVDVLLSDYPELVEALQQAVIWYFTNYKAQEGTSYNRFDNYTYSTDVVPKQWLKYASKDTPSDLSLLQDKTITVGGRTIEIGAMLQEQADILYNYLIDSANAAAEQGYSSGELGTLSLTYTGSDSNKKIVKDGANYKIGPIKASTTGNTNIDDLKVLTGDNVDITASAILQNKSGNTIDTITKGQEFFVVVPQNVVDGDITISVSGKRTKIEKKLLLYSTTNDSLAEQPIVQFYPTTTDISKSLTVEPPKTFDLALRKFITQISTDGNFENTETTTSYNRTPSIENGEITKLGNTTATYDEGTTAKKTHSKDAIEVATGNKVIYTIRVYNEGEVDGKVTEITDYLPSGLKLAENSTINTTYGWVSGSNNKVTTDYLKNETITALSGTTLNYKDVQIECEVTATAGATEQSLKNVAEITGASNDYGYTDRDSSPDNVEEKGADYNVETSPNGKGYQDDDDYEELKIPAAEGTYTIRLQKVSSANANTKLSGAEFSVELADGTTKNVTSGTNYVTIAENVAITGAGTDTIKITETKAPGGYKKLINELTVSLTKTLSGGTYGVSAVSLSDTTNASYDLNNNVISVTIKDEPKTFDLALRKFITQISTDGNFENTETTTSYNRVPSIENGEITKLGNTTATYDSGKTAKKTHSKTAIEVATGSKVRYTIRVYNEGEVDGKATEITDYLPSGLKLAENSTINTTYGWVSGSNNKVTTDYLKNRTISALSGTTLDYEDVQIECEVTATAGATEQSLKNVAEITGASNDYNYDDRDSSPDNVEEKGADYNVETSPNGKGYQDDDDYEELKIPAAEGTYTIRLQKVSSANANTKLSGAEFSVELADGTTKNVTSGTNYVTIAENVAITGAGTDTIKITETKAPGGYKKIINELTVSLTKTLNGGTYGVSAVSLSDTTNASYDLNNNVISVTIKDKPKTFDLALRKFITQISTDGNFENTETTTSYNRTPSIENGEITKLGNTTATYDSGKTAKKTHSKTAIEVATGSKVRYTIRVYNEGEVDGKATEITDYLPSGLKLAENSTINTTYGWVSGSNNKVTTDYLKNETITALSGTTLNYKDVQIECEVTATAGATEQSLKNVAEITGASNDYGYTDRDSSPDNVEEKGADYNVETSPNGKGYQDDDDYEELKIPAAEGTYTIRLQKISSTDANTKLPGAEFSVELADGTTKNVTSTSGYVTIAENVAITGAGTDTIKITETKAPGGYKKIINELTVSLTKTLNGGTYGVSAVSLSDTTNASYDLNNNVISVTIKDEPKTFDLALRKFITQISTDGNFENTETTTSYNRTPSIENGEITKLGNTTATYDSGKTAKKTHSKTAIEVATGNKVRYTIRVYNEGEVDGKATEITDYLPSGLKLAENSTINTTYGWKAGENNSVTTDYLKNRTISALSGTTLDYEDVQIECEVTATAGATEQSLKNVAEITGASNDYGYTDRDSSPDNVEEKGADYNVETSPNGKGYQDDDDYEELKIPAAEGTYTIRLQKVSSANANTKLSGAEFSVELADGTTKNVTSTSGYVTIAENVAITGAGTDTIKITETKAPGGYKKLINELTVSLTKTLNGGTYGVSAVSLSDTTNASYDLNNNVISVTIKDEPKTFDLALRKFVTKVNDATTEGREPDVSEEEKTKLGNITATYDSGKTAKKTHSKDAIEVKTGSKVRYTIRVYNEGEVDGKATEITDYLPSGLKLAENSTINTTYGWVSGSNNKVTTDYLKNRTISALSGTTLDYEDVQIECEVTATAGATVQSLKNVAEITGASNDYGYTDRDSSPDNVEEKGADYNVETSPNGKGYQDDDDYEELKIPALPKTFDLALRKFVTAVSTDGNFENSETTTSYNNRTPSIENGEITKLENTTATYDEGTTAKKTHSKTAIEVATGSKIRYTIRVYNEGEVDGKATEITDYLPSGLKLAENSTINTTYGWKAGENNSVTTDYLKDRTISALSGTTLDYEDVQIECEVTATAGATEKSLKNIAEITGESNEYNYEDRDSKPDDVNKDDYKPTNPEDGRGEQDDDDYEELKIPAAEGTYTIRLQKVSSTDANTKLPGAEFSVELADGTKKTVTSGTNYVTIAENVTIAGEGTDKIKITETKAPEGYNKILDQLEVTLTKTLANGNYGISAVSISDTTNASYDLNNNVISVTIKDEPVRENGLYSLILVKEDENGEQLNSKATFEINSEEKEINGRLVIAENVEINAENVDKQDIYTIKETKAPDEYSSFDGTITITVDKKLDGTTYVIDDIDYKVVDGEGKNITATKDAKVYLSKDGNIYVEVKNYEIKKFDLALRKFITDISGTEVTSRIPQLSYSNNKITYTHTKDTEKVHVGDIVTYTIRVYNEGEIDGFAEKITDDIPDYLEYLPDNKTNKEYRWVMYNKDGKETTNVKEAVKIVSDYTSKANGELMMKSDKNSKENPNLLKAFDSIEKIGDDNPDYVDVKVAFKVKDPKSNTIEIINKAQISEDSDKNGDSVEDIDSIPDKWNDGEDDQDYEKVSVEYFDLSLLKYVKKATITDNGKTRTIKTGNNGSDKDITPKVEVNRKRINTSIVKFEYTIEIKNEGDIAGYAREITDYVPKGLKFYEEDNKGWRDEGDNVISTELLKDTLLQPGQSATIKVILRWINGENNLELKTNVAEISKDYNIKKISDRDSTPDNKKAGEDDIDDAPVILTISTGIFENPITYVVGTLIILITLGLGIVAIKKYVL